MTGIASVISREILDGRGHPTIEVDVLLENGVRGRASAPSGVTISPNEAVERRDGDLERFNGRGVLDAVTAVNDEIANTLRGMDARRQFEIDHALIALDGTSTKARLGSNATLGVSLAVAHAAAATQREPLYRYLGGQSASVLPVPLMNVLIGGVHADNGLSFQEFMIVPVGAQTFAEAVRLGSEVLHALRAELRAAGHDTGIGDEGGFAPGITAAEEALTLLMRAIERSGHRPGTDVALALDVAASEFFKGGVYDYDGKPHSIKAHVEYLTQLVDTFPIVSIEDPTAHGDLDGWRMITDALGGRCQLVGDDLFCTNVDLLNQGIELGIGNSVLIKTSQIGTLTETLTTARTAMASGYSAVVSHRSGETEDTSIADLAVALHCGQIKAGAPARSERTAKYNQLIRIEAELGQAARYAGHLAYQRRSPRDSLAKLDRPVPSAALRQLAEGQPGEGQPPYRDA